MGQIIGGVSAAAASAGYTIVDVPYPGVLGPTIVNSWTSLSIPAYWRSLVFRAANMASFPRSVRKDNVDVKHPVNKILQRNPNNYQSPTIFFRTLWFQQAHYANGFAEIERDAMFRPIALHGRTPEITSPFWYLEDDGTTSGWYAVGGYRPHFVPSADMIHLTDLSIDGIAGLNPVWMHSETMERARLMDRYVTRFLTRGGVIRGSVRIPLGISDEQYESLHHQIRKFRGADAEEDLIILPAGAELTNNGLGNDQAEIIKLISHSTKQISQLTGVAPHFLFDDSEGKYNGNPEQAGEDVVRYLFRILIQQSEEEFGKLLTEQEKDAGYSINIDPNCLLRGDVITESNVVTQQANGGIITRNEARAQLGKPPIRDPEADKLNISGNTSPIPRPAVPPAKTENAK